MSTRTWSRSGKATTLPTRTGSLVFPTARAETDGSTLVLSAGTGYRFRAGPATFGPIAGIRYERVEIDGYTETGAQLLNLTVDEQTSEAVTGSIGAQGSVHLQVGSLKLTPTVSVALEQTLDDGDEPYMPLEFSVAAFRFEAGRGAGPPLHLHLPA